MTFENERAAFRFYEAFLTLAAFAEMYPEAATHAAGIIRRRCHEPSDEPHEADFRAAVLTFLEHPAHKED